MDTMISYVLRVLPALAVIAIVLVVAHPSGKLRIVIYIAGFILLRDAMFPLGFWTTGTTQGVPWIRPALPPLFLGVFVLGALGLVALLWFLDRENRRLVMWFRGSKGLGILIGVLGCLLVTAPAFAAYHFMDIAERGGVLAPPFIAGVFIFALFGSFCEEFLFRGYVLGLFAEGYPVVRSGLLSGLLFALAHIFLAVTVTDVGASLLLFVLWEGLLIGYIGAHRGVIPATIAHGGAVFLICSGLI